MQELINNRRGKKGFTLAELLIVVAIIAVLVAIAIPIFNSQLEKSRQSTDLANVRAAYAEAMTKALDSSDGKGTANSQAITQHDGDWGKLPASTKIGQKSISDLPNPVSTGDQVKVTVDGDTISFSK